jgi:uncharacterized membrane protein YfcA
VTLSGWEGVVILLAAPASGVLGWALRSRAAVFVPLSALVLVTAAMVAIPGWYERVPEDVQATVTFALALGALGAFVGALVRRSTEQSA